MIKYARNLRSPLHPNSHPYQNTIAVYQEYADDISTITSDKNKIDHIKKPVRSELETRKLHVNER